MSNPNESPRQIDFLKCFHKAKSLYKHKFQNHNFFMLQIKQVFACQANESWCISIRHIFVQEKKVLASTNKFLRHYNKFLRLFNKFSRQ